MLPNSTKGFMARKGARVALLLVIVVIVASMTAFSCAPGAPAAKTLKLGSIFPLTGVASGWGIPTTRGVQIGIDIINDAGGVEIGGQTYLIELIQEDCEYSSEKAATAARKLVERDKVKAIFGGQVTHTTLPILPITTPAKVPNFASCWSNEVVSTEVNAPYSFMSLQGPYETVPPLFSYITSTYPGTKRVAEIAPNTMSGIYGTEVALDYFPTVGLEAVKVEYYELDVTDFYPTLARILAQEPDVIHSTCAVPVHWAMIIKQAREMGYEGIFVNEALVYTPDFITVAGVDNVYDCIGIDWPTFGPESTPEARAFRERYIETYEAWDAFGCVSYEMAPVVAEAYHIAGTVDDPDLLVEILETTTFYPYGIEGRYGGDPAHYDQPHQWGGTMYIVDMVGGEPNIVDVFTMEEQLAW